MNLSEYIRSSLEEEAKKIREQFPNEISEQQKRAASVVLEFVKKHAIGILEKNTEFDWKHFDDFCDTFAELIDSRNKHSKSTVTGISYEGVYQKQKIEWLLDMLSDSLVKHEKKVLSQELTEFFENALEKGLQVSLEDLANRKPYLYKRVVKLLRISNEEDESEWRKLSLLLPVKLSSIFIMRRISEEEKEKEIIELIENRDLEKIIVEHGSNPRKMAFILRLLYPDLDEEQVRLITRVGFMGLGGRGVTLLERSETWPTNLSPVEVEVQKQEHEKNAYLVTGIAPADCVCILVSENFGRRVAVEPGSPFSFTLKLKEGWNHYSFFSINEKTKEISLPTNVSLEGEESDEYSVSLVALLATIEDLKERFDADEEQRALVMEMLELTFIKEFSYKFEEGESHLLQIIEKFKHNATVRQMLSEVLSTFKDIQGRQYEGMRTDNGRAPMFFQKYGVYRIEQLRYERKLPGVILAFEPGLGKTITALLAINGDETTVLCPNSVVSGWKEEAAKFFEHKSLELVYAMNMRRRVAEIESSNKGIIVTNYQTLQQIKNESLFRAINN